MKITAFAWLSVLLLASACNSSGKSPETAQYNFPAINQEGRTAVVAHRGFWNCEEAGYSENSIASLRAAQDNGFWGSEFDVQLTADDVVIVNHNNDIDGLKIAEHSWEELSTHLLPNGERRPLLEEYLEQGRLSDKTMLVCEFKDQRDDSRNDLLVEKTFELLREKGLYSPDRVAFISFSKHVCEKVAQDAPQFVNQYLNGDISPTNLAKLGINGWDYHMAVVGIHGQWVVDAHELGMSTNVWTVNKRDAIELMIKLGVDAITSNEPLLVREILGEKEYRK